MQKRKGAHRSAKAEVRTYSAVQPLEVRKTADGSKQIAGTAIVYNSRSVDLGGFTEIVSPGALTRTLKENPDVLALRDHRSELLIGRTLANTLELTDTAKGLDFVITLPKSAIGDDTAENVRLKNLTGVSFGFNVGPNGDVWSQDSEGNVTRVLTDIELLSEISICSFPAYQSSSVSTRSCPAKLRSKLTLRTWDDADDDNDLDDSDNGDDDDGSDREVCSCPCVRCQYSECSRCINRDCLDEQCGADGCSSPARDEMRTDGLRIRTFINHRMQMNQTSL
jgi:uncharacterized protein